MMADYNQLHYGARYRDLLVQMLRRRQEWEKEREKKREQSIISKAAGKAAGMVEGVMKAVAQSSPGHCVGWARLEMPRLQWLAGSSSSPTPKSPGGGLQSKLVTEQAVAPSASMGGANSALHRVRSLHLMQCRHVANNTRRRAAYLLSIYTLEPNSMWSVRTSLGTTSGRVKEEEEGTSMRSDGSGSSAAPPSPRTESQTTTGALPWELNLRRSKSTSPKEKSPPQSPSQQSQQSQQQHGFRRKMKTTVAVPAGDASAATSTQPKLPASWSAPYYCCCSRLQRVLWWARGQQEGSTQSSPNSTPGLTRRATHDGGGEL